MITAAEILEAIESFFLLLYLANDITQSIRLINYDKKKECFVLKIKNGKKIFEIFFIRDNIMEIRAYNRWITKDVVRANIMICSDFRKSLDYHHFIYEVEEIPKVMQILSTFSNYVKDIMGSE
jgi:uncharacterized CHY-type Zn-finger protein